MFILFNLFICFVLFFRNAVMYLISDAFALAEAQVRLTRYTGKSRKPALIFLLGLSMCNVWDFCSYF